MGRLFTFVAGWAVAFGLSLLFIPGVGIIGGLTIKHVIKPAHAWVTDPGPLFVDDPRCCR